MDGGNLVGFFRPDRRKLLVFVVLGLCLYLYWAEESSYGDLPGVYLGASSLNVVLTDLHYHWLDGFLGALPQAAAAAYVAACVIVYLLRTRAGKIGVVLGPDWTRVLGTSFLAIVSLLVTYPVSYTVYEPYWPDEKAMDLTSRILLEMAGDGQSSHWFASGGWPLQYLFVSDYGPGGPQISVQYLGLCADLVFWYVVTSLLVYFWPKRGR